MRVEHRWGPSCPLPSSRARVSSQTWRGYNGLPGLGYKHVVFDQSASADPEQVVMPTVHLVASLLKRWLLGTYQGAVSNDHLPYYLDEFTFRFNRRDSRSCGLLFYRLVEHAVQADPARTHSLYLGTRRGPLPIVAGWPKGIPSSGESRRRMPEPPSVDGWLPASAGKTKRFLGRQDGRAYAGTTGRILRRKGRFPNR